MFCVAARLKDTFLKLNSPKVHSKLDLKIIDRKKEKCHKGEKCQKVFFERSLTICENAACKCQEKAVVNLKCIPVQ